MFDIIPDTLKKKIKTPQTIERTLVGVPVVMIVTRGLYLRPVSFLGLMHITDLTSYITLWYFLSSI